MVGRRLSVGALASVLSIAFAAAAASAAPPTFGIALDPKAVLVDGDARPVASPPPDSIVFYRFDGANPRPLGRVDAPTSFQGPPSAIAIAADGSFALASASSRIDADDPSRFAADRRVSLIDLEATPIRVAQTIELDASPSSVALDPTGTFALVVHNQDDSVSLLSIAGGRATLLGKQSFEKDAGPMVAAFVPGRDAVVVTFSNKGTIALFDLKDGRLVMPAVREMSAGIHPTSLSLCGTTGLAVVANYGNVTGDGDTISLIDLAATPARVVVTITVGPSPEGVGCAPDGRHAAAAVQNMSTVSPRDPQYVSRSKLVLLRIAARRFTRIADADIGGWAQGTAFLDDRTLFAQSVVDRTLHLFRVDGRTLVRRDAISYRDGGPVSFGVAGR